MFYYSDTEVKQPFSGGFRKIDPHKQWLKHYGNYIELAWIAAREHGVHKFQAEKEIKICLKKLDYWYKRPDFELGQVLSEVAELKRTWNFSPRDPW